MPLLNRVWPVVKEQLVALGYYSRPGFLILGAARAGTTTLTYALSQHPDIRRPSVKEVGYFAHDKVYDRGPSWYHNHFSLPYRFKKGQITFEATPDYLYFPHVAQRIFEYDPQLKLLVMIREPVARAYSAWNMLNSIPLSRMNPYPQGWAQYDEHIRENMRDLVMRKLTFAEMVQEELSLMENGSDDLVPGLVRRGLYADQVQRYRDVFAPEQMMVINFDRLTTEPRVVLQKIGQFLGLPSYDWAELVFPHKNASNYQQPISDEARQMLETVFDPQMETLSDLLQDDWRLLPR